MCVASDGLGVIETAIKFEEVGTCPPKMGRTQKRIPAEPVGAENLRHQAILMNNAPGAVTPLNPEMVQVGDAVGQRA